MPSLFESAARREINATPESAQELTLPPRCVIFHNPTLERTTTGQGRVADQTLAELRRLQLKDTEGNVTRHRILCSLLRTPYALAFRVATL